ncbi:hypothetical protein G7K_1743-t1 [Saitoella complicata NRRL Y-17804]|uniref:Secreted protein n=1 Tax=Saitoella complicata (strain BCRC 22490 / CBS 7301 / JCM 7358 / NBRC 10748 / NRRL Y-17804) TaxID=698492 RepID=A0A0E9NCL1_SAICN|nr:hypothetical protein G7K_1743-t1 [Saitoella complicata NRRL Y-17804]
MRDKLLLLCCCCVVQFYSSHYIPTTQRYPKEPQNAARTMASINAIDETKIPKSFFVLAPHPLIVSINQTSTQYYRKQPRTYNEIKTKKTNMQRKKCGGARSCEGR